MNNIIKILDYKKRPLLLKEALDENNMVKETLSDNCTIFFVCSSCGKQASKRKSLITEYPLICGSCKRKKVNLKKYGVEHSTQSKEILEKRKKNNLEKYGVESPSQLEETKRKRVETNLKKYGVKYSTQSNEILKKREKANLEKYGVESPLQLQSIKEKIKKTNLEKYGVDSYSKTDEYKRRVVNTNIKKYKEKYYNKTKEYRLRLKETSLRKYGETHHTKNKLVKEKTKKTNLEKYGVENALITEISKLANKRKKFDELKSFKNISITPLFSFEEFKGVGLDNLYKWKCNKCGNIFFDNIYAGRIPRCYVCNPINQSIGENELSEFLSNFANVEKNVRVLQGKEIDIYLPEHKLGIEFNGLYWHSEQRGKDKFYHVNKSDLAKEKNIQLLHVFENEWYNKKEIVESILLSKINKSINRIYARNTKVLEINKETRKKFFNNNHIQGDIGASVAYGLYIDGILVSAISFGKPRYNKKFEWELLRFANALQTNVIGGFSKLLTYFIKKYRNDIITYCDKRYFDGLVYTKSGFNYSHDSEPNYFYFKKGHNPILESRVKYQKHKLKNLFENFDSSLTEYENMLNNGYSRIWDCGNKVFYLTDKK